MRTFAAALLSVSLLTCLSIAPGCAAAPAAQHEPAAAHPSDFDLLQGGPWSGTLTYLDYSSGKSTTIRSTLQVTRAAEGSWKFAVGYNDEPHANAADEVHLEQGGRTLRSDDSVEHVVRRTSSGNTIELVTEQSGEDNGKPALIRRVRTITRDEYSLAKFIRPEGQPDFFKRHEYRWTRK